jgi:hypothetical protein
MEEAADLHDPAQPMDEDAQNTNAAAAKPIFRLQTAPIG